MSSRSCALLRAVAIAAAVAVTTPTLTPIAHADDSSWVREQVIERMNAGIRLLRSGDGKAAAEKLCWVAGRALNSHEASWLCGQALLASRQTALAIGHLELATELDPRHLRTWITLGDAYLADGQIERSRAAFFQALEVRNDYSPAYDGLARLAWQQGNEPRALEIFAQALEANPADGRARLNRGRLHLGAGRIEQALADIRDAARFRPDDGDVQLGLAEVLLASGLLEDALAAARRAATLTPRDPRPLALQARVQLAASEFFEAERVARRALAIDEHLVSARLVLGEALGRSARPVAAVTALTPPDPSMLTPRETENLALRRAHWESLQQRLEALEAEVAAGAAPPARIAALARIRLDLGDAAEAVRLARRAVHDAGAESDTLRQAAYVLGEAGHPLAAESVLGRLPAGSVHAHGNDALNLGVAREMTGDPDGAAQAYRAALDAARPIPEAHLGLARLALADDDFVRAREHLVAFLALEIDDSIVLRVREALSRLDSEHEPDAAPGPLPGDSK